ncbi:Mss4-like protein [Clohesyomyces aquaticus]|uniref:Mss4-like protein n=1 Tax=Clohesyomyces aquaticus TaxID=1231657 RepID=A0A1Y2A9X6_9PLEO|nr:Mss4-like protein [Clohesyomyces aquaticus]
MSRETPIQLLDFSSPEFETYHGTCHCGAVQYSATLNPPLPKQKVIVQCNCSICSRNGYLLVYPLRKQLHMKSGEDALKTYTYGRAEHKFCGTCGSSMFVYFDTQATKAELGKIPDIFSLNIKMLKNVNFDELEFKKYDGLNAVPFIGNAGDHLA